MKNLLAWFNALKPRERQALAAGSALVLILVAYGWLWLPLASDTARLRSGIGALRVQAAQVAAESAEAKRLIAAPRPPAPGDLLASGVEQNALAAGIKDRLHVQPLDAGRVQVAADGVGFNEWVGLLAKLQQSGGARVESARVEPQAGSSLVQVQAILARPSR
jgi:type II secretory pathway component PulM